MFSLKESVFHKPTFDKVANYELPKNISEWNEEILKQFYKEINFIPGELKVDISINNVDENKGYAKGSIVVFYGSKRINFPVIVNDFKLSPFDVFVDFSKEEAQYYPVSINNIKNILSSEKIGDIENYWGKGNPSNDVKATGGVQPKESVNIYDQDPSRMYPPFSKMSGWIHKAKKEDLEKLAIQMESEPDVNASFVENTGDLVGNIINLKDNDKRVITDDHKQGILDLKDVIKSKQAVVAIDSEFIDSDNLTPIRPPSVCELRMYQYPSMEDFLESGDDISERFNATKVGKPVSGVVLDIKDIADDSIGYSTSPNVVDTSRRPQVFISGCGCYYSIFDDWEKNGIGFYGTNYIDDPKAVEKMVEIISDNITDDFTNSNVKNRYDGSDKMFIPVKESNAGKGMHGYDYQSSKPSSHVFVVFGSGNAWECYKFFNFDSSFKKYNINNTNVYVSNKIALIPANIASVQKVKSVEDPIYKMIIGKADNIYLIPESSLIINTEYMNSVSSDDFINPSKPVKKLYEESNVSKISMVVSKIDDENLGFKISGDAFDPMKKIAGIENEKAMTKNEAMTAMMVMGTSRDKCVEAMKVAVLRYADDDIDDKSVSIYGLNNDYINKDIFNGVEKTARLKSLYKDYSYNLRRDLVKEASVLSDPEAVDVVLSLNFINEDSLSGYIENIEEMKRIQSEMCKMLVAVRMGLKDLDESALKKSIEGLENVIEGLEGLKIATGD